MEFNDLLVQRRSIRKYRDEAVALETVKAIISESTLAPSSGNEQPWRFIIVNNWEMMKRISDESKKNILARIIADPETYAAKYRKMLENQSFNVFFNAPCLVMIVGPEKQRNIRVNCALAASYFMFAASSRGLGSCWVNLGADIQDSTLREELGLPEGHAVIAPLVLGFPERIPAAPQRRDPEILAVIS